MFTYAENKALTAAQFEYLHQEGIPHEDLSIESLIKNLQQQIEHSVGKLASIDPKTLTQERFLGRKRIPTTLMGLLFHAAEHAQRHVGQLLVTVRCIK